MAYCRFSSDDFRCDLYCYEDVHGGYTTHVAAVRVVYKDPLPPIVSIDDPVAWLARHERVKKLHSKASLVDITLPNAGESFHDATVEGFLDRLRYLRDIGYRFPSEVIEAVEGEVVERGSCPKSQNSISKE